MGLAPPARALLATVLAGCALCAPAAAQSGGTGSTPTGGSPPTGTPAPTTGTIPSGGGSLAAFRGNGMWIWQLPRAGSVSRIVARARSYGVKTLFIKSGDGLSRWGQFSAGMVSAFKSAGLRVCGWQYVYGNRPVAEAYVSAYAKKQGADCFVIDAESEYEGRYVAADQYMRKLRALVGRTYPIGLAPFPYVDYHPGFPYSVFLAPGAAQVTQPQMYWHTIGTSVDTNFAHTYNWTRIYGVPIFPLGQTYDRTPAREIRRFRQVATAYGASGVSWWEWTQTSGAGWHAVGDPVGALTQFKPASTYPRLRLRSKGDPVVWAQELLWTAGEQVPIDGVFGTGTRTAVAAFQTQRALAPTGVLDDPTWRALVRYRPVTVRWKPFKKGYKAYPAQASGRRGVVVAAVPRSATLPARAREIPPKPR